MTNKSGSTIYIGITGKLLERVEQHKQKVIPGFTNKYNLIKLVYIETFNDIQYALNREKQLKKWSRKKKMELIKKQNPEFKDLSEELE